MRWKESAATYYKADFHIGSPRQGSASQASTKHLLVFVCNELCLILHNLCSGGHVTEGETEGERGMDAKLKEDKECLSTPSSPQPVLFPSEYFGNNLNPVLDYKLLEVMRILFKVSLRLPARAASAAIKTPTVIQRPGLFIFRALICPVASGQSSDVMPLTPQGVNS